MWQHVRVAGDRTHHEVDGRPLYAERFDEVLSFHEPGLAAVARDGVWWHIAADGTPAYTRRFHRAFGFYEGLAAVVDDSGWYHIHPTGEPAGPHRFAWCGNFREERCPVRTSCGYRHIDPTGRPAYRAVWSYAGDYSHGYAVVQRADGLHTHVDLCGRLLHGAWFEDLDLYHKGLARAKDARGWMHIDYEGRPAYEQRFVAVEPFYNGQARVVGLRGELVVIDERGETLKRLREPRTDILDELSGELTGAWRTFTVAAAVALGLFDALPADAATLATRLRAYRPALSRLLRALGEMGLAERTSEGTWICTESGRLLRGDDPLSLRDAAIHWATTALGGWQQLPALLVAEDRRPQGSWFSSMADDPKAVASNQRAMSGYARHESDALAASVHWGQHTVIIDGGGGDCTVAVALARRHLEPVFTVLERPEVADLADIPTDIAARVAVVGADILEPWPVRADAVVLSRVLHDWDDTRAEQILRCARTALSETGHLYVVEGVLDEHSYEGGLLDIHMLCTVGGRERTLGEFERLLSRAGFMLNGVTALGSWSRLLRATVHD